MKVFTNLKALGRLLRDESGLAAIEMALVLGTLSTVMLNGVEIARYYFAQMELQNATQMAGQAVWKVCDLAAETPVTTRCSARTVAITRALGSTSLGANVTLSSGFPTEAYYCAATADGSLTSVGPVTSPKPTTCYPTGSASDTPGDYIVIQAQYTYTPIFNNITIGSLLPTTLTSTTRMRVR
jgi:Flp pilus assembly protein TadG